MNKLLVLVFISSCLVAMDQQQQLMRHRQQAQEAAALTLTLRETASRRLPLRDPQARREIIQALIHLLETRLHNTRTNIQLTVRQPQPLPRPEQPSSNFSSQLYTAAPMVAADLANSIASGVAQAVPEDLLETWIDINTTPPRTNDDRELAELRRKNNNFANQNTKLNNLLAQWRQQIGRYSVANILAYFANWGANSARQQVQDQPISQRVGNFISQLWQSYAPAPVTQHNSKLGFLFGKLFNYGTSHAVAEVSSHATARIFGENGIQEHRMTSMQCFFHSLPSLALRDASNHCVDALFNLNERSGLLMRALAYAIKYNTSGLSLNYGQRLSQFGAHALARPQDLLRTNTYSVLRPSLHDVPAVRFYEPTMKFSAVALEKIKEKFSPYFSQRN